jgi:hypothetical protein
MGRYAETTMMVRTQIMLHAEVHTRAKLRAAELGMSLAEYVRRTIALDLEEPPEPVTDLSGIFGLFAYPGGSDIAHHKDEYLGEAMEQAYPQQ